MIIETNKFIPEEYFNQIFDWPYFYIYYVLSLKEKSCLFPCRQMYNNIYN